MITRPADNRPRNTRTFRPLKMTRTVSGRTVMGMREPTWPHEDFNSYLEDLIVANGLVDRAELSRVSGVSNSQFSTWKKGTYRPSRDKLRQVAAALNVPLINLEIKAGLIDTSELDIPEPTFEVRSRAMVKFIGYYDESDEPSREWIDRKLDDLNEQIQMRIDLNDRPQAKREPARRQKGRLAVILLLVQTFCRILDTTHCIRIQSVIRPETAIARPPRPPTTHGEVSVQINATHIATAIAIGISIFGAGYYAATWDREVMHILIATGLSLAILIAILPPLIASHVEKAMVKRDQTQRAQRLLDQQINNSPPIAKPVNGHRLHLVRDDEI